MKIQKLDIKQFKALRINGLKKPKLMKGDKMNYYTKKNIEFGEKHNLENNPTIHIKFPKKLYKNSNEKNLLKEVLVWYQLKSLNVNGKWESKNQIIDSLFNSNKIYGFKTTKKTYLKRVDKLIDLGLIKIHDYTDKYSRKHYYIGVCKYDTLFEYFGINLNNPKILKLKLLDLYSGELEKTLILDSVNSQKKTIKSKFIAYNLKLTEKVDMRIQRKRKKTDKGLKKLLNQRFDKYYEIYLKDYFKNKFLKHFGYQTKNFKMFEKINFDYGLSTKKVASLFGFKSSYKGWCILRKLETNNLIKTKSRKISIRNFDKNSFYQLKRYNIISDYAFIKGNRCIINLPTLIMSNNEDYNGYSNFILNCK